MIRKLEVEGLNNRVDDAWEFNEDVNIITGRNGSGKTTLLKLIWYLISGNIGQAISELLFQSVSIETDSFFVSLAKVTTGAGEFKFGIKDQNYATVNFKIPLQLDEFQRMSKSHRVFTQRRNRSLFFPSFRRIEGGFDYLNKNTAVDDLKWIYASDNVMWRSADEGMGMLQMAMSQLSTELSVHGEHQLIAAISTNDIAKLVAKKYCDVLKKSDVPYAELLKETTELSKEIIQRISETKSLDDAIPTLAGIQKRIEEVNSERALLLKPFSMLGEQIRATLQYNGVRVTEEIILGAEDGAIDSDKLSAGEKQMLSFLCYNRFTENTAIFIDEPELSLHVDWQRRLLPTLLEQETGNQFFVATHSPFIYGKYPDKEIQLHEDRGGE